jgi:hypothetical protein
MSRTTGLQARKAEFPPRSLGGTVVFLKLSRCMAPAAGVALTVTLGLAPAQGKVRGVILKYGP